MDLGLDSILAVTWLRRLKEHFGLDLPATAVYAYPTVDSLAAHVADMAGHSVAVEPVERLERTPAIPISARAAATVGNDRRGDVRTALRASLADELMLSVASVREGARFLDLGLDSILAVTWLRRLAKEFRVDLPATSVYAYPTVEALADRIGDLLGTETETKVALATPLAIPCEAVPATKAMPAPPKAPPSHPEAIAIVGAAGRFPMAGDLEAFWRNIREGRDCIDIVPESRWDVDRFYDPDPVAFGKSYSKWMGSLDDIDRFDPQFFHITPREAELMDPQQRVALELIWHAIEDAAIDPIRLGGTRTSVFFSSGPSGYDKRNTEPNSYSLTGCSGSILSSRIAYLLDLHGPALSIDTACSSSLVSLIAACNSLAMGESDLAIAGGVSVVLGPEMHVETSKASMLSRDGRCFSFDARANGFVPAEGAGVMVLKRLADAERDGDPIHAVVRGWGMNQDGRTNGITAPNPQAQTRLLREVYRRFEIDPATIGLIEAHGTGTPLGDPIEMEGLTDAFAGVVRKGVEAACAIGSVKSNIGHALAAAGIAGALKGMLALSHRELPPIANFETLNPHLKLSGTPFSMSTSLRPWVAPVGSSRRVGVSSFGFSGTNAHVVLEEYSPVASRITLNGPFVCLLSAESEAQICDYSAHLRGFLADNPGRDLAAISATLCVGRGTHSHRLGFVFKTMPELLDRLALIEKGNWEATGVKSQRGTSELAESFRGGAARDLLQGWIDARETKKLVELWNAGVPVEWARVWQGVRREHLPGYPFARERYWVETPATLRPKLPAPAHSEVEDVFRHVVRGDDPNLAYAHRNNERLLHGLGYLEMARSAAAKTEEGVCGLKNLMWGQPLALNGYPRELHVELTEDRDGVLYQIYPDLEEAVPCHLGEVMLHAAEGFWPEALDVTSLAERMRGRDRLQSEQELVMPLHCRLKTSTGRPLDSIHLHALWPEVGRFVGRDAADLFPVAMASVRCAGDLPEQTWLRVWRRGPGLTVALFDLQGKPLLVLDGLMTANEKELRALSLAEEVR